VIRSGSPSQDRTCDGRIPNLRALTRASRMASTCSGDFWCEEDGFEVVWQALISRPTPMAVTPESRTRERWRGDMESRLGGSAG